MKKAVLAGKKVVEKAKSAVKKASKTVVKATKKVKKKTVLLAKGLNGKEVASAVVDFIPFVGNAKAAYESLVGKDPITGRKLEDWERVAAGAAIVGGAVVKGAVRGTKATLGIVSSGAGAGKKVTKPTKSIDELPKSKKPEQPEKKRKALEKANEISDVVSNVEKAVDKAPVSKTTSKPQKPKKQNVEEKNLTQSINGPYSHLEDSKFVGPGKDFTPSQKKKIIEENKKKNGGVVKSDLSDQIATKPQKSTKGVTPDPNEWQIDHIIPKDKGGTNSFDNAQVLTRKENRDKSNKLPSDLNGLDKKTSSKPERRKK